MRYIVPSLHDQWIDSYCHIFEPFVILLLIFIFIFNIAVGMIEISIFDSISCLQCAYALLNIILDY